MPRLEGLSFPMRKRNGAGHGLAVMSVWDCEIIFRTTTSLGIRGFCFAMLSN